MSNPLEFYKERDSELHEAIGKMQELAFKEGVLSTKTKFLIATAIDAVLHAEKGVTSLAQMAMNSGASEEELLEALRVASFIGGAGAAITAASGLSGVVKK